MCSLSSNSLEFVYSVRTELYEKKTRVFQWVDFIYSLMTALFMRHYPLSLIKPFSMERKVPMVCIIAAMITRVKKNFSECINLVTGPNN